MIHPQRDWRLLGATKVSLRLYGHRHRHQGAKSTGEDEREEGNAIPPEFGFRSPLAKTLFFCMAWGWVNAVL